MASKLTTEEKNSLKNTCTKTISWINENDHATEEEYSRKKQEVESICRPITMRLYSSASAGGFSANPGRQFPSSDNTTAGRGGGPIIDEAD